MELFANTPVKKFYDKVPKPAIVFLIRAAFLYIIWVCAYHFYLEPKNILDPPLTTSLTYTCQKVLQVIYSGHKVTISSFQHSPLIMIDQRSILSILSGCNALELYVFYIGFILCYSSPWKLSLKFIVGGVIGIFIINVLRCVALAVLSWNEFRYIDGVHHYVFTITVYSFIFMLWFYFFKISLKSTK